MVIFGQLRVGTELVQYNIGLLRAGSDAGHFQKYQTIRVLYCFRLAQNIVQLRRLLAFFPLQHLQTIPAAGCKAPPMYMYLTKGCYIIRGTIIKR